MRVVGQIGVGEGRCVSMEDCCGNMTCYASRFERYFSRLYTTGATSLSVSVVKGKVIAIKYTNTKTT